MRIDITDDYRRPLIKALAVTIAMMLLSLALLDGGEISQPLMYGVMAFWFGVALIVVRRRSTPTNGDLKFISYGALPVMIGAIAIAHLMCMIRQ